MLPRNHPDRIHIAFDDHRLVANAGLLLPATLALRLSLSQLVLVPFAFGALRRSCLLIYRRSWLPKPQRLTVPGTTSSLLCSVGFR